MRTLQVRARGARKEKRNVVVEYRANHMGTSASRAMYASSEAHRSTTFRALDDEHEVVGSTR